MAARGETPFYVVFAGVNGAGKSTLFRSGMWRSGAMPERMERVNPDEMLVAAGGDWKSQADQLEASRASVRKIEACFNAKSSFNQETTLAGRSVLAHMKRARSLGYRVVLLYVGVDGADVALARIAHRVEAGGHAIDADLVRGRFPASLRNLSKAVRLCDYATAFDNTRELVSVATWTDGVLSWWGNPQTHAPWLVRAMKDEGIWIG